MMRRWENCNYTSGTYLLTILIIVFLILHGVEGCTQCREQSIKQMLPLYLFQKSLTMIFGRMKLTIPKDRVSLCYFFSSSLPHN
ncbi:hypothetical protein BDP81DRAFT_68284 [Colletotrichum phormii]|uniref:Secreted protein n=1 Tax=Colletotrichum phormii TaxID=359342 RepID=A0AAJ0ECG6_9PEZI|nr:uncharacterized protein BDP81DRAFT_68284 [Colletotrichum phormii]KAK1633578.1 hypothetical protein BDP81DRAFT_68284 [Colletotrichum phormii]